MLIKARATGRQHKAPWSFSTLPGPPPPPARGCAKAAFPESRWEKPSNSQVCLETVPVQQSNQINHLFCIKTHRG